MTAAATNLLRGPEDGAGEEEDESEFAPALPSARGEEEREAAEEEEER